MKPLSDLKDLPFLFLGIDFRLTQLIGSHGFSNPTDIQRKYFYKWNELLFNEQAKYDLKSALSIKNYQISFNWIVQENLKIDPTRLVTNSEYSISEELVRKHVSRFSGIEKRGIGIIFIVESFNKFTKLANVWVTFFNIDTNEVFHTEKIQGAAGGIALRNYWGNSFHRVINKVSYKRKKWF